MTWDEYAMFSWLCTKASPRTGTLRTSWPTLGEQTGLTPNHVEKLCRALKRKRYVWYPAHRGARGRLVDVAIHKYPLAQGTYTDLSARFAAEVRRRSRRTSRRTCMGRAVSDAAPRGGPGGGPGGARGQNGRDIAGFAPGRPRPDRERERPRRRRACPARASGTTRAQDSFPRAARRSPPPWPSETSSRASPGGDRRRMAPRARPGRKPDADGAPGEGVDAMSPTREPAATAGTAITRRGTTGGSNWFRGAPTPDSMPRTARETRIDGRWPRGPHGPRPLRSDTRSTSDLTPTPDDQEASP